MKNKSPTKQSKKDKVSPESINRTQPIRVRVEHESTSKFLQNVVKLSDKLLLENPSTSANSLNTDSSSSDAATTPVLTSPKEAITEQNSILKAKPSDPKHLKCVWKGTIFMQEVAKFVTSAYNISGSLAINLSQVSFFLFYFTSFDVNKLFFLGYF